MSKTVSFFIPGEPVAQGRPRMSSINGHARMYDAPKSAQYKNMVSMIASQKIANHELFDKAVAVILTVHKSIPQSWSKKKQTQALSGEIHPTSKPDLDNYIKAVLDGMNGIVFKDDSLVTNVTAGKIYSPTPGVSVVAYEIESGGIIEL